MTKLLILTQKVNIDDPILGFFHRWILEFSLHFESVKVVCLEEGKHNLPQNVSVHSLGKDKQLSKLSYVFNFYKYIWGTRKEYDSVFVHMNPEYVVMGGLLWRLLGKKIALWYTHRQSNLKLWIAEKFSNIVFTSTKESFTLRSSKVSYMGHGIDVEKFNCPAYQPHDGQIKILQVGRITSIKHCEVAIEAVAVLKKTWSRTCSLRFIGSPVTEDDKIYLKSLERLVTDLDVSECVEFVGDVLPGDMPAQYCAADVTLNLAPTGGLDKVVLESLASGRIVFSSNQAFASNFSPHEQSLLLKNITAEIMAGAIKTFFTTADYTEITNSLKGNILKNNSVGMLIKNIAGYLK